MTILLLLVGPARADWCLCSAAPHVTDGDHVRPGGALLFGETYGDYGSCGVDATLVPAAGGEVVYLTSIDGGSYLDGQMTWFRVPETLAPGDYVLGANGYAPGPTIVVDDTAPLGAAPASVSAAVELREINTLPCGCEREAQVCVTVDVAAPGAPGWTLEIDRNPGRTWLAVPPEGLASKLVCVSSTCAAQPGDEVCVDLATVDPLHVTVGEWGPFCATWPAETGDTGTTGTTDTSDTAETADTGAGSPAVAGCGCASGGGRGLSFLLALPLLAWGRRPRR